MNSNLIRAMFPGKVIWMMNDGYQSYQEKKSLWLSIDDPVTHSDECNFSDDEVDFVEKETMSSSLTQSDFYDDEIGFLEKEPMSNDDYESVEHPRLELHLHVATKFVQVTTMMMMMMNEDADM